jgi:zinc protease
MKSTTKNLLLSAAIATLVAAAPAFAEAPKAAPKAAPKGGPVATDWKKIKKPPLNAFTIPEPKRIEFSNGITLFLIEDHELPFVDLTAMIRTGGRLAPADKTGIAEIFGEVWRTGGTKTQTGDALDDYLEARAAKVETWMDDESAGVSANCLKQDFDDVLKVFDGILRQPAFAEEKIKIARTQVTTGIARRNDDPSGIAYRESTKLGYGATSPYARQPEYATVASITRDDLVAWHAKYVQPGRILLGVYGDFSSADMEKKLRAAYESWPKGPEAKDAAADYDTNGKPGVYVVEKDDVNQSNIQMVHLGITRDNPDYHALEVMNEVFGGGFAARLFTNVRSKKGLAYSVGGGVGSSYDHPGLFRVGMSTKSGSTAAAIDALFEEIDAITGKKPASADELQRAKESILNSFIFKFDSKDKVLRQQMLYAFYGYPADFLARYRAGIEKVTIDDVNRVAKKYIHRDKVSILVVGKSADFDKPLSTFGTVNKVDITIPEPPKAPKAAASAETLEKGKQLWGKVVEGLGGKLKVAAVKEIRTKAKLSLKKPMPMTLDAVESVKFPDSVRQDLTTPMGAIVMVASPKAAFQAMGPQSADLPPSAKDEMIKDLKRNPILISQSFDAGKVKANAAGSEKIGAVACEILDIDNEGVEIRFFVDPTNGRILRSSYRATGEEGPVEAVTDYADWKQVDGLWVALSEKGTQNGEEAQSVVKSEVKFNPGLDAKLFEKPAAK